MSKSFAYVSSLTVRIIISSASSYHVHGSTRTDQVSGGPVVRWFIILQIETGARLTCARNFLEIWAEIVEINERNLGRVQTKFLLTASGSGSGSGSHSSACQPAVVAASMLACLLLACCGNGEWHACRGGERARRGGVLGA